MSASAVQDAIIIYGYYTLSVVSSTSDSTGIHGYTARVHGVIYGQCFLTTCNRLLT